MRRLGIARHRHRRQRLHRASPTVGARVVVLLGMREAGATTVTEMLRRLGLPIEPGSAAPAQDAGDDLANNRRIGRIHERLLAQFGLSWQDPQLLHPLPDRWQQRTGVAAIRRDLIRILRNGLSANRGLWGFWDPHTVRFLPLWHEVLAELGATPCWIMASRHPAAVTGALTLRSGLPRERCELLWIEHTLDVLAGIAPGELTAMSFERLLADPVGQLRRLAQRLPLSTMPSDEDLATVAATVQTIPSARYGELGDACTDTATMLHDWLQALSEDRPLPDTVPGHIATTAARDLASLVDRERAHARVSRNTV